MVFVGLFVQPYKCLAWVSFGLPFGFIKIRYPFDDIKIFGVPFGYNSFAFFLLQMALGENVQHINVILKLGDI